MVHGSCSAQFRSGGLGSKPPKKAVGFGGLVVVVKKLRQTAAGVGSASVFAHTLLSNTCILLKVISTNLSHWRYALFVVSLDGLNLAFTSTHR